MSTCPGALNVIWVQTVFSLNICRSEQSLNNSRWAHETCSTYTSPQEDAKKGEFKAIYIFATVKCAVWPGLLFESAYFCMIVLNV